MNYLKHNKSKILLIVFLAGIGIASRLVHHRANFAPVAALSLLGAAYLPKKLAWLVPALIMAASDIFLGFHNTIPFTWGSYILIAVLGGLVYSKFKKRWMLAIGGPIAALIFFVITNFGVWLVGGMYSHNLAGLARCFTLAIPFFRPTLVSDTVFTMAIFMIAELASRLPAKRFKLFLKERQYV